MKRAVFALIALISIIIFSGYSLYRIDDTVCRTIQLVSDANKACTTENALSCIENAEQYWKQNESYFGAVMRHDEIDDVIDSFALLKAYASNADWDDYYGNCASLLARLEHVRIKERPLLQNIL